MCVHAPRRPVIAQSSQTFPLLLDQFNCGVDCFSRQCVVAAACRSRETVVDALSVSACRKQPMDGRVYCEAHLPQCDTPQEARVTGCDGDEKVCAYGRAVTFPQLKTSTPFFCSSSGFLFVGVNLVSCHSVVRLFSLFFPLLPVVGLSLHFSSSSAFLRSLFTHSSHLRCGLPRFLQPSCFFVSDLFGNLSSFILTVCPAHFLAILPTIQALVPISA